jgi:uncharacterized protein YjbI with pentapeptide repeats
MANSSIPNFSSTVELRQASNKESRCKYWLPEQSNEADYSCRYEMLNIDVPYCIFHLPAREEDTYKQLTPQIRQQVVDSRSHFTSAILQHLREMESNERERIIDCRGFRFPNDSAFHKTIEKRIDFSYAVFEDVDLSPDVGYGTGELQAVNFKKGAIFTKAEFKGAADFSSAHFHNEGDFTGAFFRASANFDSAHFETDAVFQSVTFKKGVGFQSATFCKAANFFNAEFGDGDSVADVSFYRADFIGTAEFGNARFRAWANFNRVSFHGNVSFIETVFEAGAAFRSVAFSDEAVFAHARFSQKILFQDLEFGGDTALTGIDIAKDANVTFEKVRLGKVSFEDTNLELINFRDVTWANAHSRFRPFALWDEFRPENANYERDYEKIAENYRQLVINYEKKRDYDSAETFHIGEMETRRKKKADRWRHSAPRIAVWLSEWFNAYGLYRLLSTYGTSYWQAVLVLALFIFISALSFMYSGFETETTPSRVIEYNLMSDSKHQPVSAKDWLSDYKEALSYSLSIVTFQRERFYKPTGLESRLYLYVAVVVLTAQLAMVLLAVRRRFKR